MNINAQQINAYNRLNDFMDFAQASENGDVIAKFNGQTGKVTTAEGDRIKGLFTWTAPGRDVDANNATRNAFKSSLLALFGKTSIDQLPPSVKNVLKAGDYDNSGKPLSARRISAVMTAVKETSDYTATETYAKLTNFTEKTLAVSPDVRSGDADVGILKANLKEYADNVVLKGGLKGVIIDIAGPQANVTRMVKAAMSFTLGIGTAFTNGGAFIFSTGEKTDQRLAGYDHVLSKATRVENEDSRSISAAVDTHLRACKDTICEQFAADNPGLKATDRDAVLQKVFAELDKIADRIKIRMAGLMNLDRLPGNTILQKIVDFERQVAARLEADPAVKSTDAIKLALGDE